MVEEFDGHTMSETQVFTVMACEPFGIDGMNDLHMGSLEASLVGFVLDDELFVFQELAQMVHLVCADSGGEWARVLGYNE